VELDTVVDVHMPLLLLVIPQMADMVVLPMLELVVDPLLPEADLLEVEVVAHAELEKLVHLVHPALTEMMVMMVLPVTMVPLVLMPQLDLNPLLPISASNVNLPQLAQPVMLDLKVLPEMLVPLDNPPDLPLLDKLDLLAHPAPLVPPADPEMLELPALLVPYKMFPALPVPLVPLAPLDNLVNPDKLEQAIPDKPAHLALLEMPVHLVLPDKLVPLAALEKLVHPEVAVDAITALPHVPHPVIKFLFYQNSSGFNIVCCFASFIVFVIYVQNGKEKNILTIPHILISCCCQ